MSSLKQIEANRRNAFKSTGPTTPNGKRRSRCNALRHGLTAETVIAALEDLEDYEAFEAAVISDYAAELAVERELVLRLASVLWRLRRATGIETALFESVTEDSGKHKRQLSREHLGEAADLAERHRLLLGVAQESNAADGNELSSDSKTLSPAASCAWQICRLAPSIASAATNTCCGGKRDRLCLRWSCCGAASERRAAQPFHFRFGGASPAPCPKSSGDYLRGQRSTSNCQRFAQRCIVGNADARAGLWRAANSATTRVDVELEQQNRDLLRSMNERTRLQLRLQATVEGLSVATISYYVVGLFGYLVKGAHDKGAPVDVSLATALFVPVAVLAIWWVVRRVRRKNIAGTD